MQRYARKLEETYITMRLLVFAYIWAQFREKFEDLWESFKHFQDFFFKVRACDEKTVATHTLQNSNELAFQTDADYMKFKYRISSYSFRGNYSFLTLALCTVTFGDST